MVGGNLADTAYRSCAAFTGSTAFFTLVSAVLLWRAEQGSQKAGQFRISGFSPLFGSAALPREEGSWVLMTADTGSCHEQSNPRYVRTVDLLFKTQTTAYLFPPRRFRFYGAPSFPEFSGFLLLLARRSQRAQGEKCAERTPLLAAGRRVLPTSASKAPLTAQFVVNLYEDGTVDSQMTRLCETNFIDVIRAIARGLFEVFERLPF